MGKIRSNLYLSIIFLFISLLPTFAQNIDYPIKAIEEEALLALQEMAFDIKEEGNLLSIEILSFEVDDALFAPDVLVKSDIVVTKGELSEMRSLYFLSETKDAISSSYIAKLNETLSSILSSLYSLESAPYRLYFAEGSPLSARRDGKENLLGKRFITSDMDENPTSLLLVTSADDEFMYLSPLWAKDTLVRCMHLTQSPSHAISIQLPFNLNSLSLNAMYELFPIWGVVMVEAGLKGDFDFISSSISLFAQGGLKGTLPFSIFFSDKNAHLWYSKLSFVGSGLFGVGLRIENDTYFTYQSSISLLLQYQLQASLALSAGALFNHTTYKTGQETYVEYGSTQVMLGLSIVW